MKDRWDSFSNFRTNASVAKYYESNTAASLHSLNRAIPTLSTATPTPLAVLTLPALETDYNTEELRKLF